MKIDYVPMDLTWKSTDFFKCPRCGAILEDKGLHTDFHKEMMQLKDFADRYQHKL